MYLLELVDGRVLMDLTREEESAFCFRRINRF